MVKILSEKETELAMKEMDAQLIVKLRVIVEETAKGDYKKRIQERLETLESRNRQ